METFLEIIRKTPWWVFCLFVGLVLIGLKATRPRNLTLKQLFLLPLVFMIWNLVWLNERIQGHYSLMLFWVFGVSMGAFFGWLMVRRWNIEAHRNHCSMVLPPTWSTLILILLVFAVRYFFIYNYEMHPEAASHLFLSDALVSGVITGIFVGRAIGLFLKYIRK